MNRETRVLPQGNGQIGLGRLVTWWWVGWESVQMMRCMCVLLLRFPDGGVSTIMANCKQTSNKAALEIKQKSVARCLASLFLRVPTKMACAGALAAPLAALLLVCPVALRSPELVRFRQLFQGITFPASLDLRPPPCNLELCRGRLVGVEGRLQLF